HHRPLHPFPTRRSSDLGGTPRRSSDRPLIRSIVPCGPASATSVPVSRASSPGSNPWPRLLALSSGRRRHTVAAQASGVSQKCPRSEEHTSELQSRENLV